MKSISNYIGFGTALTAFVGLLPFVLNQIGVKMELGIIIDAICIGLFVPIILYSNEQHN